MKRNLRFRLIATVCVLLVTAAASAFETTWDEYMEAGSQALQQRQYAEAEKQFKSALQEAETFEALDPRRAVSLNHLGVLYSRERKNAEAEESYKGALAILEKALGPEHLDVTQVLDNLAWLYEGQGKSAEAEPFFKRELTIYDKNLGSEDRRVGKVLNNLGKLYSKQSKYAEAEQSYERALAIYRNYYGPEHWRVGAVLNNFADAYLNQRKHAEAERLYEQALAILKKDPGPEHTRVARAERGLARSKRGTATAEGSSSPSAALAAQADGVEGNRQTAAGAAEPEGKRQTFNVLDMSFEIPARGWELLSENETGVELLLKYGDRRGEMIAIDRVLFPPKLRRLSRKQHASTFFQMERRKPRYEGTRWKGFTEDNRQIGEQVYPTMSFRVTSRNVGMTQDGLFLLYFPEDFTEKHRFFSLMWLDTHPTDAEGRGLAEFDAFVSGLRIRSLGGDRMVIRHIMPPGEKGWKQALDAADKALKQQDYADAEQFVLFALKEAETFGPQDRRLALTLNNLAYLYNAQRRYGKAQPLYKRSLAIYEGLGEEDPSVANTLKKTWQSSTSTRESSGRLSRSTSAPWRSMRPWGRRIQGWPRLRRCWRRSIIVKENCARRNHSTSGL